MGLFLKVVALAYGFVDEYSGCNGDVEGLDVSELRNHNPLIAKGEVFGGDAFVFGSHDDADRIGEICFRIVVVAFLCCPDNAETTLLEVLDGIRQVHLAADGEEMEGSG